MHAAKDQFDAKKTTIIAISADKPADLEALVGRLNPGFQIISDTDLTITKGYGAVENGKQHPAPTIFVLDENRKVLFMQKGKNAKDRPTTEQLIAVL